MMNMVETRRAIRFILHGFAHYRDILSTTMPIVEEYTAKPSKNCKIQETMLSGMT